MACAMRSLVASMRARSPESSRHAPHAGEKRSSRMQSVVCAAYNRWFRRLPLGNSSVQTQGIFQRPLVSSKATRTPARFGFP